MLGQVAKSAMAYKDKAKRAGEDLGLPPAQSIDEGDRVLRAVKARCDVSRGFKEEC